MRDAIREGLLSGSIVVHDRLARTDLEIEAGLWIATDKDLTAVGDPLAAIAGRHSGAQVGSPDIADLIAAAVGLFVYLGRNARKSMAARRALKAARATDLSGLVDAEQPPAA